MIDTEKKVVPFWRAEPKRGRKRRFESPEEMWEVALEYFDWVEANPLLSNKIFSSQGGIVSGNERKMRAMTRKGFYVFSGIGESTYHDYQNRDEYKQVIADIETIIDTQKFEGACAGLFSTAIIARDLGLAEKKDIVLDMGDLGKFYGDAESNT